MFPYQVMVTSMSSLTTGHMNRTMLPRNMDTLLPSATSKAVFCG